MHPMVAALVTAFVLRWLGFYVTNQVKQSVAFIPLVYAVPGLSGAAAAFVLITGRKPKMPKVVTDVTGRLRRLFSSRLARNSGSGNA